VSEALLATKLYVPRAPAKPVLRPRLVQQVNEGLARPLTLIAAPAGFGKTTLLSQWHADPARSPWPVAWLSLDASDNDPARFLAYCIAALQTVEARLGETARVAVHSPQPPPLDAVLTALVNDLTTVSGPFVIVFDDYDVIEAQPIHDIVTFLLDHAPPEMRLVITSRADPPLPLTRLRARGQLTELRAAEAPKAGSWACNSPPIPCKAWATSRNSSRPSPATTATCWTT
jgi:LuxR family maltose regulon positive regulatory protein